MIQNKSSTCNSLYMNVISFILCTDSTNVQKILLLDTGFSYMYRYLSNWFVCVWQVVDMRWGVPEEASDDHSTSSLCLAEVLNCQKLSTGPNFVVILLDSELLNKSCFT